MSSAASSFPGPGLERLQLTEAGELCRLDGTVCVLGEDQDIDHADSAGVDQGPQLCCHFTGEAAGSRRERDDEIADGT